MYLFKPDIFGLGCLKLLIFQNLATCSFFLPFSAGVGRVLALPAYLIGLSEDKLMDKGYTDVVAIVILFISNLGKFCHVTC